MTTTTKAQVEEVAAAFPGPNMTRLVVAAQTGVITWDEAAAIAAKALATGLEAVKA